MQASLLTVYVTPLTCKMRMVLLAPYSEGAIKLDLGQRFSRISEMLCDYKLLIFHLMLLYMRGTQKWNLFIKNCIYSFMFKFQSPSRYSPFDAINLSRHFFHCSKQFLNS